ncbi:MAG TPA: serine/threonine-protein kinase [Polyangia bacterium]|jgi:serine/threonine protein kinase
MKGFPRRFGPYALAKPLARGGMGALYLAVHPDRNPDVCVIKTVLPHLADKEYLQRFRDEAKVVVQLSHQNLVPVFDSGQVGGEIYLGMEFVDGRDLRAIWNRCAKKGVAFPIDVAAYIAREVALGLEYAHGFGDIKLVHRDVSPPNVLVAFDGKVSLTDFGLASSTLKLEKTAPGIIYGKVSYMSPEQARGEPLDGRTDLFATGIILWELLTGRQVYPAKNPQIPQGDAQGRPQHDNEDLLRRVRRPVIAPPSQRASRVPPELDRIAMLALAPKLSDRYPSCAAFARDLSTYLAAKHPETNRARVAAFLSGLYSEDLEGDRAERDAVIADARDLAVKSRAPAAGQPIATTALPVMSMTGTPSNLSEQQTAERGLPGAKPPPPVVRRSGRGTVVAGPVANSALSPEQRDEVSAAFAETVASSSNSMANSGNVIGSLVGGRYRIRRLSGEGGMGRVYEAEHIEIGKRVALKILHPGYSQTPDLVERLRREARAASRIGHPNVVDVTDSGTTEDGSFFFVMEYLEGRELGDVVFEEKGLAVPRAIAIAIQICRALRAAHAAGVIHRDLKPENVLLVSRDGQRDFVKVLDFGIAKNLTDGDDTSAVGPRRKLTNPGVAMGTPEYMAPEQAAGRPADARSDIYALGGVLYEMLVGHPAYEGANFMEVLHKKANFPPQPISKFRNDVPPDIEALILSSMAKDPAARPQSMSELEQRLQELARRCFTPDAMTASGSGADTPRPVVLNGAAHAGAGRWAAIFADRRRVAAAAGAACMVLTIAAFGIARARMGTGSARALGASPSSASTLAAVVPAAPQAVQPTAPPELPPAVETAPVEEPAAEGEPAEATEHPAPQPTKVRGGTTASSSPGADRKMMEDAEGLLRAQKFPEARALFSRLAKNRPTRGRALVALAEIAFQEKNYQEAIRSAKLATERGGGARAHVVLGDAHFRMNEFPAAVTSYQQALRLEPGNPSAKSGLALASKRL